VTKQLLVTQHPAPAKTGMSSCLLANQSLDMTIEDEDEFGGGSIFQMKLQPVVVHEG
jgi:hypothetical protein